MYDKYLNIKHDVNKIIESILSISPSCKQTIIHGNINDLLMRTHEVSSPRFREVRRYKERYLPDSPCWSASWARRTPWCCRVVASLNHAQIVSDCNRNGNETVKQGWKWSSKEKRLAERANASKNRTREVRIYDRAGCWPFANGKQSDFQCYRSYAYWRVYFPASWLVSDVIPGGVVSLRVRLAGAGAASQAPRVYHGDLTRVKSQSCRPDLLTGSNENK